MDRLALQCFEILERRHPARATLHALEGELKRDRVAVTRSVLQRSLRIAKGIQGIDPWLGPNRSLDRSSEGSWWVLNPCAPDPGESRAGPPGTATPVDRSPWGFSEGPGHRLDRALRTLAVRGDAGSPRWLARWVRLCDEADAGKLPPRLAA